MEHEIIKVRCAKCNVDTNHKVLKECKKEYSAEELKDCDLVFYEEGWQIIQCCGCEKISFREYYSSDETVNYNTNRQEEVDTLYPSRGEGIRRIKDLPNTPLNIRKAYVELINAINAKCEILSVAGIRVIIESICAEKKITSGPKDVEVKNGETSDNLKGKINGLYGKDYISKSNFTIFHKFRFIGNDALHKLKTINHSELMKALDIIENVIRNIYENPMLADEIKKEK